MIISNLWIYHIFLYLIIFSHWSYWILSHGRDVEDITFPTADTFQHCNESSNLKMMGTTLKKIQYLIEQFWACHCLSIRVTDELQYRCPMSIFWGSGVMFNMRNVHIFVLSSHGLSLSGPQSLSHYSCPCLRMRKTIF